MQQEKPNHLTHMYETGKKKSGAAFLLTREVSSQECVYRCMPELWLCKTFAKAVFISTDLPDKSACDQNSK